MLRFHKRRNTIVTGSHCADFSFSDGLVRKFWPEGAGSSVFDIQHPYLQLDCRSATRTQKNNLPANHKGYDTFETTVGKLLARRIQI